MRVRGLKLSGAMPKRKQPRVAPRAGAWVETSTGSAPSCSAVMSHPVRVRGLKQLPPAVEAIHLSRTPCGCVG